MVDRRPDTPRNRGDSDAPHYSPVTPSEDIRTIEINRVAWGAIFAGVALALIAQVLLNMIGIGIGMATLDPGTRDNPSLGGFGIGAGIWWVLSGIIASFLGGLAAGRLSGQPRPDTAAWHGLITWAVASIVIVYLLSTAVSSIIGGAMGALGNLATTTANAAAASPNVTPDTIISGVESATAGTNIAAVGDELAQDATQVADTATSAASAIAWASALSLILGGVAAWFGGRAGAVNPTLTRRTMGTIDVDQTRVS